MVTLRLPLQLEAVRRRTESRVSCSRYRSATRSRRPCDCRTWSCEWAMTRSQRRGSRSPILFQQHPGQSAQTVLAAPRAFPPRSQAFCSVDAVAPTQTFASSSHSALTTITFTRTGSIAQCHRSSLRSAAGRHDLHGSLESEHAACSRLHRRPRAPGSRQASRRARRRRSRPARWRRRPAAWRPRWKVAMLYAALAEQRAEPADEARLVAVGHVEHVRPELRLHVDALDLDDARLAVGEDRAGDRALLPSVTTVRRM